MDYPKPNEGRSGCVAVGRLEPLSGTGFSTLPGSPCQFREQAQTRTWLNPRLTSVRPFRNRAIHASACDIIIDHCRLLMLVV
jgi:hypothetical protein